MPQASDELRAEMQRLFNDPICDTGPIKHLESGGYTLLPSYFWKPPEGIQTYADMAEDDWLCLAFLCDEWDFGGFENANAS